MNGVMLKAKKEDGKETIIENRVCKSGPKVERRGFVNPWGSLCISVIRTYRLQIKVPSRYSGVVL